MDLHICIVGARMSGLACVIALAKLGVKHINIYETASNLRFVGPASSWKLI
jgi:salicylate hydroxylase